MEEISKQINQEGKEYIEVNAKSEDENVAELDTVETVEAEEQTEDVLADLEYADGKERDELDLVEEQEKIFGTNKVSPFKTADIRLFKRNLESMSREQMQAMAERVAARTYSAPEDQKEELVNAFRSWASTNGYIQTDVSKKAEKGALSGAFEGSDSVNTLVDKLKEKTLSDLQETAARLGFNPGFDRERLITLITQEYRRQS